MGASVKMIIQVISDIHAEFHWDFGDTFINILDPTNVDVLIVAGDLGNIRTMPKVLSGLCARYAQICVVLGNHSFYNSNWNSVWKKARQIESEHPNLHILENETVIIKGQRFIGCTMWFPDLPDSRPYWGSLNDFHVIKGFSTWFGKVNRESVAYLRENVQEGDVVVTHHLPSYQCVHPQYAGSPINGFFVCDVEDVIREKKPKLWACGHSHSSYDGYLESTRLVLNPFGYALRDENPAFEWHKIVEVGRIAS